MGGAQINAINLGKALTERGHRVWFVADEGPLVSRVVSGGMDFIHVPYNSEKHPSLAMVRRLVSAVKAHGIDLVQAFDAIPILEAYAASLWLRKPAYGIASMQALPSHRLPKSREIALVNAETRERYIHELGWDPKKLRLLLARLDCTYYRPCAPASDSVLSAYDVRPDERVVALVTRVDEDKWPTIDLFISAAEHWATTRTADYSLRFVIVGGGPLLGALRERVSQSSTRYLVVTGELTDIPAVMNNAGVVLGMASTCQQGLACGRPVIVVGRRGYTAVVSPESFESLAHRHFNLHTQTMEGQPETLCRQIDEIVSSSERAEELGSFGRRIALERFDSRIGARQLEEVYEKLIASNSRSLAGRGIELGDLLLSLGSLYRHRGMRRERRFLKHISRPSPR